MKYYTVSISCSPSISDNRKCTRDNVKCKKAGYVTACKKTKNTNTKRSQDLQSGSCRMLPELISERSILEDFHSTPLCIFQVFHHPCDGFLSITSLLESESPDVVLWLNDWQAMLARSLCPSVSDTSGGEGCQANSCE